MKIGTLFYLTVDASWEGQGMEINLQIIVDLPISFILRWFSSTHQLHSIFSQIRHWAVSTVKSLGTLDWDDYDELEDVVKWLITVITFNLFVDPVQDVGKEIQCIHVMLVLWLYILLVGRIVICVGP